MCNATPPQKPTATLPKVSGWARCSMCRYPRCFFFIGTALFGYYAARPDALLTNLKSDAVFPHFIATALPMGLSGLIIAAIFAAAQSTLSSSINCSATLVLCDFYKRYWNRAATERQSMRVLRIATVIFGAAGTIAALAMLNVKSALDAWWKLSGIFGGGILGLFLLGRLTRASNRAALTATIAGVAVIAWMTFLRRTTEFAEWWRSPFHEFLVIVFGTHRTCRPRNAAATFPLQHAGADQSFV